MFQGISIMLSDFVKLKVKHIIVIKKEYKTKKMLWDSKHIIYTFCSEI